MRSPALQRAREAVPHCVATALFDLSDGSLLSSHADAQEPASSTRTAAVAMRDLLRLPSTDDDANGLEVVVGSGERIHVGLRSLAHSNLAVLFVCRAEVSVGMAIARARICLLEIEETL